MARSARIYFPGGIFHIVSRFSSNKAYLTTNADRARYFRLLGETAQKTDAIIYACCVLPTHVHLVVRQGWEPLERLMKPINTGIATWIKKNKKNVGDSVFQDRYRTILAEDGQYLWDLIQYVHNAPVRYGKFKKAIDSKWSTHRAYMGEAKHPPWLDSEFILSMVGDDLAEARDKYSQYVTAAAEDSEIRPDLEGMVSDPDVKRVRNEIVAEFGVDCPILGSVDFAQVVKNAVTEAKDRATGQLGLLKSNSKKRPTLRKLISVVRKEVGISTKVFQNHPKQRESALARKLIVYLWVSEYGGKQVEVANYLNASSSAVTRWYSAAMCDLPDLEEIIIKILTALE